MTRTADLKELLECTICRLPFTPPPLERTPKELPCHHIFCASCIKALPRHGDPLLITCPLDQQNFSLSDVLNLPDCAVLVGIISMVEKSGGEECAWHEHKDPEAHTVMSLHEAAEEARKKLTSHVEKDGMAAERQLDATIQAAGSMNERVASRLVLVLQRIHAAEAARSAKTKLASVHARIADATHDLSDAEFMRARKALDHALAEAVKDANGLPASLVCGATMEIITDAAAWNLHEIIRDAACCIDDGSGSVSDVKAGGKGEGTYAHQVDVSLVVGVVAGSLGAMVLPRDMPMPIVVLLVTTIVLAVAKVYTWAYGGGGSGQPANEQKEVRNEQEVTKTPPQQQQQQQQ